MEAVFNQYYVQGASHIAEYLLNQYGEDSFAMIVDEGGLCYICY